MATIGKCTQEKQAKCASSSKVCNIYSGLCIGKTASSLKGQQKKHGETYTFRNNLGGLDGDLLVPISSVPASVSLVVPPAGKTKKLTSRESIVRKNWENCEKNCDFATKVCNLENGNCIKLTKAGIPWGAAGYKKKWGGDYIFNDKLHVFGKKDAIAIIVKKKVSTSTSTASCYEPNGPICSDDEVCDMKSKACIKSVNSKATYSLKIGNRIIHGNKTTLEKLKKLYPTAKFKIQKITKAKAKPVAKAKAKAKPVAKATGSCYEPNGPICFDDEVCDMKSKACIKSVNSKATYSLKIGNRIIHGNKTTLEKLKKLYPTAKFNIKKIAKVKPVVKAKTKPVAKAKAKPVAKAKVVARVASKASTMKAIKLLCKAGELPFLTFQEAEEEISQTVGNMGISRDELREEMEDCVNNWAATASKADFLRYMKHIMGKEPTMEEVRDEAIHFKNRNVLDLPCYDPYGATCSDDEVCDMKKKACIKTVDSKLSHSLKIGDRIIHGNKKTLNKLKKLYPTAKFKVKKIQRIIEDDDEDEDDDLQLNLNTLMGDDDDDDDIDFDALINSAINRHSFIPPPPSIVVPSPPPSSIVVPSVPKPVSNTVLMQQQSAEKVFEECLAALP